MAGMTLATRRPLLLRFARLAVLAAAAAALGTLAVVGGCNGSDAGSPCSGPSCGPGSPGDAGPDDACPAAIPQPLTECAVSPLVTCSYGGQPCSGGVAYYCSGYHWFLQAQVCGNPGPSCPTYPPPQGTSCSAYGYGFQCDYGVVCDAGQTSATCTNGQWSIAGGDCLVPPASAGSPLCGIPASGAVCDPDLGGALDAGPGCGSAPGPSSDGGADGASDGGLEAGAPSDAGPAGSSLACRVLGEADGSVAPACAVAGSGDDGAACTRGADCAAGFECVGTPGKGVCRRYCCDNACAAPATDAGGSPPFCDIEPVAASPTLAVPVCVQKPSCVPFTPCPDPTETCAVVDSQGTTACVAQGAQTVGEDCERAHCRAGLACWGVFPERTCAQLCDAVNPCPGGQTCQSNYSNFGSEDTSLGICQ
jgi:hypothetical protein